jgi:hypothetical protein
MKVLATRTGIRWGRQEDRSLDNIKAKWRLIPAGAERGEVTYNPVFQEVRQRCPSIGRGLLLVSRQHEAYVKTDCRSGASPALSKLGGT